MTDYVRRAAEAIVNLGWSYLTDSEQDVMARDLEFKARVMAYVQQMRSAHQRESIIQKPESPGDRVDALSEGDLVHTWDYNYAVDDGVEFSIHATLELRYLPAVEKYVVSERGADPTEGRHWNPKGRPNAYFPNYADALRAYRELAQYYAPRKVVDAVSAEVKRRLKRVGKE